MKEIKSLFLVDDDVDDQFVFTDVMKDIDASVTVHIASNGREALTMLHRVAAKPDLILVDLNMPVFDGFEFLERIRAHEDFKDLGIIVWSTSNIERDREKALELGARQYFIKPSNFRDFKDVVQSILEPG